MQRRPDIFDVACLWAKNGDVIEYNGPQRNIEVAKMFWYVWGLEILSVSPGAATGIDVHNASCAIFCCLESRDATSFCHLIILLRFRGLKGCLNWQIWIWALNLEAADEAGWWWPWINGRPCCRGCCKGAGTSLIKKTLTSGLLLHKWAQKARKRRCIIKGK